MLNILLIGCGRLGSVMATRWLENKDINLSIVEPSSPQLDCPHFQTVTDFFAVGKTPDIIVIAVKPNIVPEICATIRKHNISSACIISVAAGKTLDDYAETLGAVQPVIWAIPNSAAQVSESMSVYCTNKNVTNTQEAAFKALFTPLGKVAKLEDPNLMHAVIALASSAPAFYYLFAEYMEQAASDAGLPAALAKEMQQQVLAGVGAMIKANPARNFSEFREAITSPQGTTAAGVTLFEKDAALKTLVLDAAKAAETRSKELSN